MCSGKRTSPLFGLSHRILERVEEGGVGRRIVEGAAVPRRGRRRRAPGSGSAPGRRRRSGGFPIQSPMPRHSSVRAHQRDVGVVPVEGAAAQSVGDGLRRPEVHHVECADRADVGEAGAGDGAEAVGAVAGARRREGGRRPRWSSRRSPRPAGRRRRASPSAAAGAGGVEDEAVVGRAERSATRVTQGVVTPNIVRPSAGRASATGAARVIATIARRAVEDTRVMPVEAGDIGDRGIKVMSETPT